MNIPAFPYRIFSLGDQALTIDYGNVIDETINEEVIARYYQLKNEHIHNNPVVAGLVPYPAHYLYSSAGNYAKLSENLLEVMLI